MKFVCFQFNHGVFQPSVKSANISRPISKQRQIVKSENMQVLNKKGVGFLLSIHDQPVAYSAP